MRNLKKPPVFLFLIVFMTGLFIYSFYVMTTKHRFDDSINLVMLRDDVTYQLLAVNLMRGYGYRRCLFDDTSVYKFNVNRNSFAGGTYALLHKESLNFHHSPGYPLFLAGIYRMGGVHPIYIRIIQAILLSAACAGMPLIAFLCWGSWGIVSGSIGALIFIHLFAPNPSFIMAEPLMVFLFFLWILFFIYWEKEHSIGLLIFLGVLCGLCILVKGTFAFVPLLFLIYLFSSAKNSPTTKRNAFIFILSCVLVILPWSVYSSLEGKKLRFLCGEATTNLLQGNNEYTIYTGGYSYKYVFNHDYLYYQLTKQRYSKIKMLFTFFKKYYMYIPELLKNKVLAAFDKGISITLFLMFMYYSAAFYNKEAGSVSNRIPAFPLILFLNIALISIIYFGYYRLTQPFVYAFLLPASYGPFYIIQHVYGSFKKLKAH